MKTLVLHSIVITTSIVRSIRVNKYKLKVFMFLEMSYSWISLLRLKKNFELCMTKMRPLWSYVLQRTTMCMYKDSIVKFCYSVAGKHEFPKILI